MGVKSYRVNEGYALGFTSTLYHLPNALTKNIAFELANPLEPLAGFRYKRKPGRGRSTMLFRIRHRQPQTPPLLLLPQSLRGAWSDG